MIIFFILFSGVCVFLFYYYGGVDGDREIDECFWIGCVLLGIVFIYGFFYCWLVNLWFKSFG